MTTARHNKNRVGADLRYGSVIEKVAITAKPRYWRCFACGEHIRRWMAWEDYLIRAHQSTCQARKQGLVAPWPTGDVHDG